jgi:predicted dehydrogenase
MTLKTAVVGGGVVSSNHLDGLALCPSTDLVAVCDVDESRLREVATEYDVVGYTDVETMVSDADLDWVHVCTPVATHLPIARTVIEAGVPVLIQKPVTETVEEYEELERLADRSDVSVAVVHNHVFDPTMRRLTEAIAAGTVGDVRSVDVLYAGQTAPDEKRRGDWAFDLPGGEFEEGLPHPLYLMLRVGGYPTAAEDVQAVTHLAEDYELSFTYDGAKVQYLSEDDVLCSATLVPGDVPEKAVHVHGTAGVLVADLVSQTLLSLERDYEASPIQRARHNVDRAGARLVGNVRNAKSFLEKTRDEGWAAQVRMDPHYYQFDVEAAALESGEDPAVPRAEGGWTIRLMEAIRRDAAERAAERDGPSGGGDGESDRNSTVVDQVVDGDG